MKVILATTKEEFGNNTTNNAVFTGDISNFCQVINAVLKLIVFIIVYNILKNHPVTSPQ